MLTLTYDDIVTPELLADAVEHYHPDYVRDYHLLHCLVTKYQPKTFLEIGTHIGTGTKIIKNALGPDSTVYSLDLPADQADISGGMHPVSEGRNQAVGSACDLPFIQLWGNTLEFDFAQLGEIKGFFIDADHDYEHPYKETLAAIAAKAQLIIWHDADAPQVWKAIVDAIPETEYQLYQVINTRIAYATKL